VQTDLGGPAAPLTTGQSVPGVADTIEAQAAKGGLQYLDYQGQPSADSARGLPMTAWRTSP
jgi:hypothetical protein